MNKRPHILIFNPDQWRGDVMGHIGNPAAVTPNLDRMVEEDAVAFRHAFSQCPTCTPSRCSFMTGWYPHVRGHRTMFHMLHPERGEPNLLKILKEEGYFVWWGGKNDLVPAQDGFEDYCHLKFRASKEDYERWGHTVPPTPRQEAKKWRGVPGSDTYYSFYIGRLDPGKDRIYCDRDWSCVLGAIDFIREYDGKQPLCIYLPLAFPHPLYGVEDPWYSLIDRTKLPPRAPTPEVWEEKPSFLKAFWERSGMQGWTEERWTELRATYYGMCARVDHQFGLVVDALKDAGLYKDTAILFFSDHGDFTGDYGLVQKAYAQEDCLTRVPFIIKPPTGVPVQPRVSEAIVELIDFAATVYDLTGIEPGYTCFGRSLLPVVSGETDEHRDAAFSEGGRLYGERQAMHLPTPEHHAPEGLYWPSVGLMTRDDVPYNSKNAMCRTKESKYVRRLYEQDQLYDLVKDPHEMNNLIEDPQYAEVLAKLKERMLTWYMETCDVVPYDTDERE